MSLKPCAVPVGVGLPAMRPAQAIQDSCFHRYCIGLEAYVAGAGLPAKNPMQRMAPASPVFAGTPAPTGAASGLTGVCHSIFSACEIERRPRGASRAGARSYVCFEPVTPVTGARDRLVRTTRYRAMRQGVRAQIP